MKKKLLAAMLIGITMHQCSAIKITFVPPMHNIESTREKPPVPLAVTIETEHLILRSITLKDLQDVIVVVALIFLINIQAVLLFLAVFRNATSRFARYVKNSPAPNLMVGMPMTPS